MQYARPCRSALPRERVRSLTRKRHRIWARYGSGRNCRHSSVVFHRLVPFAEMGGCFVAWEVFCLCLGAVLTPTCSVLLDLDGTLIDSQPGILASCLAALRALA